MPAHAGIHDLPSSQRENSQIPACAGMAKGTVGGSAFTAVSMTGRFPGVATGPDARLCGVQAALSGRRAGAILTMPRLRSVDGNQAGFSTPRSTLKAQKDPRMKHVALRDLGTIPREAPKSLLRHA
jgi:hypothetical protein